MKSCKKHCQTSTMHPVLVWRNFRYAANSVPWVRLLRHNRVHANDLRSIVTERAIRDWSAQVLCAYAQSMRDENYKIPGCWLYIYCPLYFTRILPLTFLSGQYKKKIDRSIMLMARMGRYGVKLPCSDVWYS